MAIGLSACLYVVTWDVFISRVDTAKRLVKLPGSMGNPIVGTLHLLLAIYRISNCLAILAASRGSFQQGETETLSLLDTTMDNVTVSHELMSSVALGFQRYSVLEEGDITPLQLQLLFETNDRPDQSKDHVAVNATLRCIYSRSIQRIVLAGQENA